MGNPEGPADFSEGFPGFPPCQGFEDVAGQLELPAEPYAWPFAVPPKSWP